MTGRHRKNSLQENTSVSGSQKLRPVGRERRLIQREADIEIYGDIVMSVFGPNLNLDALKGLLLEGIEMAAEDPGLIKEWAALGAEYRLLKHNN